MTKQKAKRVPEEHKGMAIMSDNTKAVLSVLYQMILFPCGSTGIAVFLNNYFGTGWAMVSMVVLVASHIAFIARTHHGEWIS